jgi:hypothetical protein
VRVGDDIFHQPIALIPVPGCHSISQRIGLDTFNLAVEITPFFVKKGRTIRN